MTKKKGTLRALLSSVLALVMCMSMLIGTTFAWFTDSVTSANNVIKSGNLDIDLEYSKDFANWATVEGASDLFSDELWEPGHVEVVYLRLTNKGTLAAQYHLGVNIVEEIGSINVAGKEFKLSDYIEFGVVENVTAAYADRETAVAAVTDAKAIKEGFTKASQMTTQGKVLNLALVVYIPKTVGNEANYKTGEAVPQIDLGVNAVATQYTYEEDSFGTDYDDIALVATAAELKTALEAGKDVVLAQDVDLGDDAITLAKGVEVSINLNGNTISGVNNDNKNYMFMVQNGATLNIQDNSADESGKIVFKKGTNTSDTGWAIRVEGKLNLESGTIELADYTGGIVYCVDVTPNAWGSAFSEATVFTMNGGKLVSSYDAIRVASFSSDSYTNISSSFVMNGGEIVAARDGIFMQQTNEAYDTLSVEINDGTITGKRPIRVYGPDATSVNADTDKPMTITAKTGSLVQSGEIDESWTWHTANQIAYGGGMTLDNLNTYATITIA